MTKIKICGIKSYEDAKLALDLGADALGFNFVKQSPRYIAPSEAKLLVRQLPPSAWFTGIFVNAPREEVLEIARMIPLDTLQFHGEETPEYCTGWKEWRVIKALRVGLGAPEISLKDYSEADYFLFDSFNRASHGGTGELIPDELLPAFEKYLDRAFLAGGLTPDNVAARVTRYRPFGVDVASGVESTAGKKDPAKTKAFITALR